MIKCKQTHTVITLSSHIILPEVDSAPATPQGRHKSFSISICIVYFYAQETGSPIYLSQPGCGQRTVLMILTEQLPVSRRREPATQSDTTAMTS